MDRWLQMTFLPHIENTWNFFIWFTDSEGSALPLTDAETDGASLPKWLQKGSVYPFLPYQAEFSDDKNDYDVSGALMPMDGVFRLIRDGAIEDRERHVYAGITVQWFRQISESIDILLAGGLFFPFFYHVRRGKNEHCYYCQWVPEAGILSESGLFADFLNRLPRLAFSINDLQDQKVQQWLFLVIIYWLNARISSCRQTALSDMPTDRQTEESGSATEKIAHGHPLTGSDRPWLVLSDPEQIKAADRLEWEMAGWARPSSAQARQWTQALLNYRREQAEAYFEPEKAGLYLRPAQAKDLFSSSAVWNYEISISGWKNGRRAVLSPESVDPYARSEEGKWLTAQSAALQGRVPQTILSLLDIPVGSLTVDTLAELFQYAPLLAERSIQVVFPDDIDIQEAPPLSVDLNISRKGPANEKSLFSLSALINYDWRIAIGDLQLSADEFRRLVTSNQSFIRYEGQWLRLPVHQLRQTYEEMEEAVQLLDRKASIASVMKIEAVHRHKRKNRLTIHVDDGIGSYLGRLLKRPSRSVPLPDTFTGTLRPYQQKGYTWLVHLRRSRVGGCLADDMGLGKTVQAIAYLDYCRAHPESDPPRPALIVCPTSLVANWEHECGVFSPHLDLYIHHGSRRLNGPSLDRRLESCDVVITSYTIYTKEADALSEYHWSTVILDEAQAIKNPHAQKTRALRHVHADHRFVLTGTPIENRLEELWSIMEFLNPGYLGSLEWFRTQFIRPIEKEGSRSRARRLTQMIRPFLLRREKTDKKIIRDLPDKVEARRICNLTKKQASLYQSIVNRLQKNVVETEGIKRKGLILSALTRLKQICDHPALVGEQPAAAQSEASGKLSLFLQVLDPLFEQEEKVIVFTQYVKMGTILADTVRKNYPDATVFFLNGTLRAEQRQKMIDRFQNAGRRKMLFILSLKAGGIGINLTSARYVIHYDRWWNPAVEEQATDRAYRIGQERNVYVYKLICAGTLEERIDRLIEQKKGLQKQILNVGESWLTEMSDQDLLRLIQLHEGAVES